MDTLEMLEVFGIVHFYDVATLEQVMELQDMEAEALAVAEGQKEQEKILNCADYFFGV